MPRFGLLDEDDDFNEGMVTCPSCKGKTTIFDDSDPEDYRLLEKTGKERTCPTCKGTGNVEGRSSFL
jgi:DnaJ-class molecular chaperone